MKNVHYTIGKLRMTAFRWYIVCSFSFDDLMRYGFLYYCWFLDLEVYSFRTDIYSK